MLPQDNLILWQSFKSGSRKALDQIFDQHVRMLYDYAFRLSSDYHISQDCIQELFVTLWSSRERLSDTDNIRFYLMKSLRRCVFKSLEKESKLGVRERIEEDFDFEIEFSHEFKIINDQISRERNEQLNESLQLLTKRQREAIYNKYYLNLTNDEIAELMGLTLPSVYNLISKALESLTEHFKVNAHRIIR